MGKRWFCASLCCMLPYLFLCWGSTFLRRCWCFLLLWFLGHLVKSVHRFLDWKFS
jgi:hypothetical protein